MAIPADLLGIDKALEADIDLYIGGTYYDEGIIAVDDIPQVCTGCTCAGALKATDTGAVLVAFTSVPIDAAAGKFSFKLTPAQTAALTFSGEDGTQLCVYDYMITDGTDKVIFRRGKVMGHYKRNAV